MLFPLFPMSSCVLSPQAEHDPLLKVTATPPFSRLYSLPMWECNCDSRGGGDYNFSVDCNA